MNKKYLLLRLISSPFSFAMFMIASIYIGLYRFILFMRYGGEIIAYKKEDKPIIHDIYLELKKQRNEKVQIRREDHDPA
jgi:hypothetical protein